MQIKQILIVDDDPEDRAIIQDAMNTIFDGDILVFTENGEKALEFLESKIMSKQLPCLVVLDLNMPKLNGTETLRKIKQSEAFNKIKVIIYSTSINPFEKERCMELGAHDYISKPLSFAESKVTAQKLLSLCDLNR